jgi:hypothetical protein
MKGSMVTNQALINQSKPSRTNQHTKKNFDRRGAGRSAFIP